MGKVETPISPYLYRVGKMNESQFTVPEGYAEHSRGLFRYSLVDRSMGSVHMSAGICRMAPGGEAGSCVHAYEKGIYVLSGQLDMSLGASSFRLTPDSYALVPYATPHAFRNSGKETASWFEMLAPQPRLSGGLHDPVFVGDCDWPAQLESPALDDPRTHFVGHFKGQRPMIRDASGIRGLKVYRFMEREFGAEHFFMMRGELEVGGVRGRHDHAVEEIYFALSGAADIEIEGERHALAPGDFAARAGQGPRLFQEGGTPFLKEKKQAPALFRRHPPPPNPQREN